MSGTCPKHVSYLVLWLRLFCFGFFRACPGQLLVYAICKEGYPENRGKKVALVSPAMEKEVCKKKVGSRKKKVGSFHNFNIGRLYSTDFFRSLYDLATPERSKWVQEAGKIVLAQISEKRCEAPRQKKYHYARRKKHVKTR